MRAPLPLLLMLMACPAEPACDWAELSLEDTAVAADGDSQTLVTVVADPRCARTGLSLELSHGELDGALELDDDGEGIVAWSVGNVPGAATATLDAYALDPLEVPLRLDGGTATGSWLSVWGSLSGEVSHAAQVRRAEESGVDVLWWSDPVSIDWVDRLDAPVWDEDQGLDTGEDPDDSEAQDWWSLEARGAVTLSAVLQSEPSPDGQAALALTVSTEDTASRLAWGTATWEATQGSLHWPLLADVNVKAALSPPSAGGTLRLEVLLSDARADVKRSAWVVGDNDGSFEPGADDIVVTTAWETDWTEVELPLSSLLADELDGDDHALVGLRLWVGAQPGASAVGRVGAISIEAEDTSDLDGLQADVLTELDTVTHRFAQTLDEGAADDLTFIAWGSALDAVAEAEASVAKGPEALLARLEDQGALLGLAHPFGTDWAVNTTGSAALALQSNTCDTLSEASLYGVDVLEVGYAAREVDLATHLQLWDCLSADQLIITGVAGSPGITPQDPSTATNPFATWVLAYDDSEQAQLDALRAGRVFFGNPSLMEVEPLLDVVLPARAAMGQVAPALGGARQVVVAKTRGAAPSDVVQFIINGRVEETLLGTDGELQADGTRWFTVDVQPTTWTVLRVMVLDVESQLKMASNPIYLSVQSEEDLEASLTSLAEARWPR